MKNFNKYIQHFITITKHKYYVGIECFKRGLYWQGIVHDLSKYSVTEFFASAAYFQGDRSSIEAEKEEKGYSLAWLNHKAKNKHHWMYWTDREDGEEFAVPMPKKYIIEMLCDFIGAGKVYNPKGWTTKEPLQYYEKTKHTMLLHEDTRVIFERMLRDLATIDNLST